MPTMPCEVTASMEKNQDLMAEVKRLAGPQCKVLQGWVGEDTIFIVAKEGELLHFLSLTQTGHQQYRGYIDNTQRL